MVHNNPFVSNCDLQENKLDDYLASNGNFLRVHSIRSLLGLRFLLLSVAGWIAILLSSAIDTFPDSGQHSFGVYADCTCVFSFDN